MEDLTLHELMGDDHNVIARKEGGQIKTTIINSESEIVYDEISHPYAWESLVAFARNVLHQDEKIQKEIMG